ncbi:MAG TPA: Holliday junction resolvase RuvX [Candidatus Dormibacteraeota bacterium]|nr:Holliday junction resolvase RuvX [Candidatus Dormibacteraeota bacterium]
MAKVLGIDYGLKRVGLAFADMEAKFPVPFTTLSNNDDLFERLKQIVASEDVDTVVVGLPRSLEGEETAQTKLAAAFAKELQAELGVPVEMVDEAGTSEAAIDRLGAKKARGKEKGLVDQEAAVIILEDYLNEYDTA